MFQVKSFNIIVRLFHRYIRYRFSAVLFNNRRLREIFKNILCTPGWLWSIFMVDTPVWKWFFLKFSLFPFFPSENCGRTLTGSHMSEGKIGSYIYFIDSWFSILNSINLILQNLENRVYLVLVIYDIKIKKIVFKKIETPNSVLAF